MALSRARVFSSPNQPVFLLSLRAEGVNDLYCFIQLFSVGGVGYYALYFSWLISFLITFHSQPKFRFRSGMIV